MIIIAACIPSLRPFASSVGQSLRDSNGKFRPKRTGYQQHDSDTPFALKPMVPGEIANGANNSAEGSWSQASSTPSQGVKKTTDIVLEWH